MKRLRIKCARCGKRRVPPRTHKTVRHVVGRKVGMCITWSVSVNICICDQCNKAIEKLMLDSLYEKI